MRAASIKNDRDRKITVSVPTDLLERAQKATGEGISATVRKGLELVMTKWAYEHLRMMRGKLKLSIDLDELRKDREY